jgi:hypothetical protein
MQKSKFKEWFQPIIFHLKIEKNSMSWFGWGSEETKKEVSGEKKEETSSSWFSWGSGETEKKAGQVEGCSEKISKISVFLIQAINASIEDCLKVISDYNSYPKFLNTVTDVKIIKDVDENVKHVYYNINFTFTTVGLNLFF